jgi:hypothetical protein
MRPPKFTIKTRHRTQARRLGYIIAPSKLTGKETGCILTETETKVASIGAKGYWDYASYLDAEEKGKFPKGYADEKRKQYRARHSKEKTTTQRTRLGILLIIFSGNCLSLSYE